MLSPYKRHTLKWQNGCGSGICESAMHRVFSRGYIPCDVLFIGEAPGISEDTTGLPFIGPAGKLLDDIICRAWGGDYMTMGRRVAFTNLVGCIPLGDDGSKTTEPPKDAIKACQPRLIEFVRLCKPRMIVLVGAVAKRGVSGQSMFDPVDWLAKGDMIRFVELTHPAAILRANVAMQGLAIQRCVATLATAIEQLTNG